MNITTTALSMAIGLAGTMTGCTYPDGRPDNTGSGALIGGGSGAVIGALADRGAPGTGALIGGAAGVIAGGLVGHSMDQQAEARSQSPPPAAYYPPPPPTEPVVVAPGPGYVWIDGEWSWNGAAWVWVPARWAMPPYPHAVWVGPRWHRGPHGWHGSRGHWQ